MNPVRIGVRKPPKLAKVSVTPIIVPANIGATSDGLIFVGVVHDIHNGTKLEIAKPIANLEMKGRPEIR